MPNITGYFGTGHRQAWEAAGAFITSAHDSERWNPSNHQPIEYKSGWYWYLDANRCSSAYALNARVRPQSLSTKLILKY